MRSSAGGSSRNHAVPATIKKSSAASARRSIFMLMGGNRDHPTAVLAVFARELPVYTMGTTVFRVDAHGDMFDDPADDIETNRRRRCTLRDELN